MHLHVEQNTFIIELTFWEKVWSMHGSLRIPLEHIKETKWELPPSTWKELRIPGTFIPGIIKAGTYYTSRGKEFWSVTRWNTKYLVLELIGEKWKRVVIAVPETEKMPQGLGV